MANARSDRKVFGVVLALGTSAMPLNEAQLYFVTAYLSDSYSSGSGQAEGTPDADNSHKAPLEYWNSGKEAADNAISALQKSLKEIGNPDLDKIAEFGLHGFMKDHQVKLTAALIDYSRSDASNRARTAQEVIFQCKSYKSVLNADTVIKLCEANPFGIKADIRGPLNSALKRIEAACVA